MYRGRRYSVNGQRATAASAPQTILGISSTTAVRPFVYDLLIGSSASPADNAILWSMQRFTASGTGTSVTPQALDSGDPASTSSSQKAHTVDPTYTANAVVWYTALNQRATHRWVADPDGAIVCPATANNGVGLFPSHASFTGNADATIHFGE